MKIVLSPKSVQGTFFCYMNKNDTMRMVTGTVLIVAYPYSQFGGYLLILMSDINLDVKGLSILKDISVNNINGSLSIQNVDIYNKDIFVYSCTSDQILSINEVLVWNQTNVGKSVDTNGFRASRSGNYMIILNLYLSSGSSGWNAIRYAINGINSVYEIYSTYQNNSPDNLISATFVVNLNANDLLTLVSSRNDEIKYTGSISSFQGFFIGTS